MVLASGALTDQKRYQVLGLDLTAPVEALVSILAGNGVEGGLPDGVGGGIDVFNSRTGV